MQPDADPPGKMRHPVVELLARYKTVLGLAWEHRRELAGSKRLADEAAFLPAALSLQDTPVHPAPRRFAWVIMALFAIALLWATLGKVDIVAVAPGRIVVSERTKVVQPLERSVVKAVLVKDGDLVRAGQALVELDPTTAQADRVSAQDQIRANASEVWRARALGQLLRDVSRSGSAPAVQAPGTVNLLLASLSAAGLSEVDRQAAHTQLLVEWNDISARLAKLSAEASRRHAEIATALELVGKLETTVPLAQGRETDFKKLVDQGYVLGRGYGADTVYENDATPGNSDLARFGAGIAADQLWFRRVSSNLEVGVIGTGDKLTLSNWYSGSQYHVEQFKTSNGKTLLDSQVQNLVSAMAAFAPPAMGQTTLSPTYASLLSPVIAANWQ